MTLLLETEVDIPFDFDYSIEAQKAINAVLDRENFEYDVQVSLTLTDEENIRRINKDYRDIDSPTDVLSFPMLSSISAGDYSKVEDDEDNFDPDTGEAILGDIVLCVPRIVAQAEEYGHSVLREYTFLIVHSVLHLLGYDHMEDDERVIMEGRQDYIMSNLGVLR